MLSACASDAHRPGLQHAKGLQVRASRQRLQAGFLKLGGNKSGSTIAARRTGFAALHAVGSQNGFNAGDFV
jgi:hypothetical protein